MFLFIGGSHGLESNIRPIALGKYAKALLTGARGGRRPSSHECRAKCMNSTHTAECLALVNTLWRHIAHNASIFPINCFVSLIRFWPMRRSNFGI